jgi:RecA-family ATPase
MPDHQNQWLIDEFCRGPKDEPNGNGRHGQASVLSDDRIIELCRKAKNAAKFASLFDDGATAGYGSASEADLALISILAFYTQEPDQLDRLYRRSALCRQKWERHDYRQHTIDRAVSGLSETYSRPNCRAGAKGTDTLNNEEDIHSFDPKSVVSNESISLPFRSAKQIAEEVPAETPWTVKPWFAEQTITEVSGQIKRSGKTTFLAACARKVVAGEKFLGQSTKRTKVLYLTEQGPTSFRRVIKGARLEDQEDFQALYLQDVLHLSWPDIVRLAVDYAKECKAGLLIVDVLTTWARIEGDGENSAGAAQEAMRPLKEAASSGLTVVYARHDRKSGGEVGQSGRGSSQFGGDADQLLLLKRPEGNTRPTVRVLEAVGRFDETPDSLMIELDPNAGEYKSLGDSGAFVEREAMEVVVEILPTKAETALSTDQVVDRAGEHGCKRSAVINALNKLSAAEVIVRVGKGRKGSPRLYYKPMPGEGPQPPLNDSFETPTLRDQTNESEGAREDVEAHPLDCECIDCTSSDPSTPPEGWQVEL